MGSDNVQRLGFDAARRRYTDIRQLVANPANSTLLASPGRFDASPILAVVSWCVRFPGASITQLISCLVVGLGAATLGMWAFLSLFDGMAATAQGPTGTSTTKATGTFDANPTYDTGKPHLTDIWVDPVHGSDSASGRTRAQALKTLQAAIVRIPTDLREAQSGYRIMLAAGDYLLGSHPSIWMEGRKGTFEQPIVIESADGPQKAVLPPVGIVRSSYVYLQGVKIVPPPNFPRDILLHLISSDHVLVRNVLGAATGTKKEELPAVNCKCDQSKHLYVEDSEFDGAGIVCLDYVACQYGHIVRSKFHHSFLEAIYVKGGSAGFVIAGNEIWDSRVFGFCAGEGTGFEYMVKPWLHFEAYDIKFVNNVIHDTGGPGIAICGGYNCLVAYNTCYRVGRWSNPLLVGFGARGPGSGVWSDACEQYRKAGGWCSDRFEENIPCKNVYLFNNVVLNDSFASERPHFGIAGPVKTSAGSNLPSEARVDDGLLICGNVIWNGPAGHPPLGPAKGTAQSGYDERQLHQHNTINQIKPRLVDPQHGDFRLIRDSLKDANGCEIPDYVGGDLPAEASVPQGELCNQPSCDRDGKPRCGPHPGA